MRHFRLFALLSLVWATGCDLSDSERILGVDANGAVAGIVFLDRDGDRKLDPAVDGPVPSVRVSLVVSGTRRPVAGANTDVGGGYWMPNVPVGSYQVTLDSAALGDSLRLFAVLPAEFVVSAGDTSVVALVVGHPLRSVAEVRQAPAGRRVTMEGVALNDPGTYGDSTLHIAGEGGSIRAVQLRNGNVAPGDSLRLIGVTGQVDGEPALLAPEIFVLGRTRLPAVTAAGTGAAAVADGGRLDAAQVRVADAAIMSTSVTADGDLRLLVDDGSGMLEIVLDQHARITSDIPILPGARLDATGLLVPTGSGRWRLKPRMSRDLAVRVPSVGAAALRSLPAGRFVAVEGVALNGWATFGDATLHLADASGSVLAVRVPDAFVFAGDSVRVLGVVGVFNGRAALVALGATPPVFLKRSEAPPPVAVTTGVAADARGGALDAALVRVSATVQDTASSEGGDMLLTMDDGSGPLTVVLSGAAGVSSRIVAPQDRLEVTGLLTPLPGGRKWALRPRMHQDFGSR